MTHAFLTHELVTFEDDTMSSWRLTFSGRRLFGEDLVDHLLGAFSSRDQRAKGLLNCY